MPEPEALDWRAYLNRLAYCYGCGRFGIPMKSRTSGQRYPLGWKPLYQPHHDAPGMVLACGETCASRVKAAMKLGPVHEPIEVSTTLLMSIEAREAMMKDLRQEIGNMISEEQKQDEQKASITIIDGLESLERIGAEASQRIHDDLTDRRGFISLWESLEEDVRTEIQERWRTIIDDCVRLNSLSPEDLAMLQALISRSPALVATHMEKVRKVGSGQFMGTFYKGYGHASIGDCGTTSIFIEGVSMLAAKAIQDWPLYSGQEASTRYMDFSTTPFDNPISTPEGAAIQERWRRFYIEAMPAVQLHLFDKYPRKDEEDEKTYKRAIAARAFDIMRAFLPAGAHTNLSWTTNLRQASDKLRWLSCHPDHRISRLGMDIDAALHARYPSSFGEDSADGIAFRSAAMLDDYFLGPHEHMGVRERPYLNALVNDTELRRIGAMLAARPRGVELPPWLAEIGVVQSEFTIDFGSFRDVQRHRAGVVRMPMLTTKLGFHQWYFDEMPPELVDEAKKLVAEQAKAISELPIDPVAAQSYVAMGFLVPCRITQSLPAFVYRLELRSSKTVHPTLRSVVLDEIAWFKTRFPKIALHVDTDPDSWTTRRGKQTIEAR